MIDYLIVAAVALLASALTLFSGFGLGTLLMPVLALLFPLPLAIAATAIVHLANNLFKLALVARHANWEIVGRFGVPREKTVYLQYRVEFIKDGEREEIVLYPNPGVECKEESGCSIACGIPGLAGSCFCR